MNIKTSELDNKTLVFEIEPGDTGPIVDRLDVEPNGFAIMGDAVPFSIAVIDTRSLSEEWFTEDHLLAIEAHELGHIRMNSPEEPIAEREGIRLLQASGHHKAAELLIERGIA
tara:strand:- start:275 stop:613 length:339 start_codon:yes stop_codon:yes gene_type:complete